ncbi:hypothetical protein H6F43_02460 [Leptolyngbya sp. FACHB-36]|uniref:DUF6915 family protein n=1 Tax=Leptolyngbya sp. FACHB-36 TaxID=2692808 RepID=UPI001681A8C4|nr:hypothetical protein [Leptolyngbya sp. FACHB-36]MBD2019049.1 hypothetical protein [Leptolyngbya sp. FACHB-36]
MTHSWYHSIRSADLFGGVPEDYLNIHNWFDETKAFLPDLRHRALRHHAEGIFLCEQVFGITIENTVRQKIPVRLIAEQHIQDDLGWIPTVEDWLCNLEVQPWMTQTPFQPLKKSMLNNKLEPSSQSNNPGAAD